MPTSKEDLTASLRACVPTLLSSTTTVKFNVAQFVSRRTDKVSKYYSIRSALGSGGYGEVFLAKHKGSGAERAIKVIDKSKWHDSENEAVINEFEIVKDLDHPNLLKMYEMFEDHRHFYIITDIYKGGELFDVIEAQGALAEEDAAVLIMNVLSCVNYCHKKMIVHRDLKPENILLTESKKPEDLKIIDFGLATYLEPMCRLHNSVGSAYYKAPEVVNKDYCEKCDIWSVGVICFILLGGYAPFDGENDEEITKMIIEGDFDFDDPQWEMVSDYAMDFIEECLTYNEKHRPSAAEALSHPWLEKIRKATQKSFLDNESAAIQDSLQNMASFHASSKLKQATLAYIASQLLLKEEKEAIDEVFRALDMNQDGKLTRDEIKTGYKDFYDKDLSDDEVEAIFKRVNFRGTGTIDYSEFVVASMFENDLLDDARLEAAFKNFDKSGDGYIDAPKIKELLSTFTDIAGDMDEYIQNKIIKEFDREGRGRIGYEDFKYMMFHTVKEQPRMHQKRLSLLNSFTGFAPPLPGDLCLSSDEATKKEMKRNGSIKDIVKGMNVMSMFNHAKEGTGTNPLFKNRQRFGSVRSSANSSNRKLMPARTTTRERVELLKAGDSTAKSLKDSYSGELQFNTDSFHSEESDED